MNYTYAFILGRYPDLSKVEIFAVLRKSDLEYTVVYESGLVLLLSMKVELPVTKINLLLGGTVKIGQIFQKFPQSIHADKVKEYLTSDTLFINYFINIPQKPTFGISLYPYHRTVKSHNPWARTQRELLKIIKEHLDSQGFKSRYPNLEGTTLSSASVEKNKLISDGVEILLIETPTDIFVGKTLIVQEFESFSERDFGRPKRDMDSGIMPPKIARMMINIAESPTDGQLLDPFCGSGTLVQEALLLGYSQVIGSDLSPKAVRDTKENLEWLKNKNLTQLDAKILNLDTTKLSDKIGEKSINAIVTEPYMGPNLQFKSHLKDVQSVKSELETLYLASFKQFAKVLKDHSSVVMIFPIFHVNNHYLYLDILEKIALLGFSQVVLTQDKRNSVTLGSKRDFVLREILKWKREDYE